MTSQGRGIQTKNRGGEDEYTKGICETTEYLEAFLRNLLLDEENELHSRKLHIRRIMMPADMQGI